MWQLFIGSAINHVNCIISGSQHRHQSVTMVRYELWYALYTDAADICGLCDNGEAITGQSLDPTQGETQLQYL